MLELSIPMDDEDKNELFKEKTISNEVNVSLKAWNGLPLWPSEQGGIRILENSYGGTISVHHTRLKMLDSSVLGDQRSRKILVGRDLEKDIYVCEFSGLTKNRGDVFYEVGVNQGRDGNVYTREELKMNVKLETSKCRVSKENTKQTTCNLKVTDGNDLEILNQFDKN